MDSRAWEVVYLIPEEVNALGLFELDAEALIVGIGFAKTAFSIRPLADILPCSGTRTFVEVSTVSSVAVIVTTEDSTRDVLTVLGRLHSTNLKRRALEL